MCIHEHEALLKSCMKNIPKFRRHILAYLLTGTLCMLQYLFSALLHKDMISFSCIFHCFSTHSKDCWRDLARQTHIFVPFEIGKQYCKLAFCLFGPNCPNCPFCCCGDRGDFLHLIRRPFSKLHLWPTSNVVDMAIVPELLSHANHASSSQT